VAVGEIVEAWLQTFPSREAAIAALEQERIPCAPVLTLNDAMSQPHLTERGTVRYVTDPQIGRFAIPGNPVRFSEWQHEADLKADLLGEHNEEILGEIGFSKQEIDQLYSEKILVQDRELRVIKQQRRSA
jgi:CoA:oxalate CoA-transferase